MNDRRPIHELRREARQNRRLDWFLYCWLTFWVAGFPLLLAFTLARGAGV